MGRLGNRANGLSGKDWGCIAIVSLCMLLLPISSYADEKSLLTLGIGIGGVLDNKQEGYLVMEYRPSCRFYTLTPWITFEGTRHVAYVGVGFLLDVPLGEHLICTPSFGGGYYETHNAIDLGYALEFRSAFELSYHFSDHSRVGVSFGHYSNASFSNKNPGIESLKLTYSLPF